MPDDVIGYSREHPSPRYRELTRLYAQMHGEKPEQDKLPFFPGFSMLPHAETIHGLIARTGSRTVLDYGSGKGLQHTNIEIETPDGTKFANVREYWGVDRVVCFDPGVPEYSMLPPEAFDGVICTDVLEHCPEEDIPWILDEMMGKAKRFVFATVALYPAVKILPNGENAHCTLKAPEWWRDRIDFAVRYRPALSYRFELYPSWQPLSAERQIPPLVIERSVAR